MEQYIYEISISVVFIYFCLGNKCWELNEWHNTINFFYFIEYFIFYNFIYLKYFIIKTL